MVYSSITELFVFVEEITPLPPTDNSSSNWLLCQCSLRQWWRWRGNWDKDQSTWFLFGRASVHVPRLHEQFPSLCCWQVLPLCSLWSLLHSQTFFQIQEGGFYVCTLSYLVMAKQNFWSSCVSKEIPPKQQTPSQGVWSCSCLQKELRALEKFLQNQILR